MSPPHSIFVASLTLTLPSSEEDVIRQYFEDGYKYADICKFLKLRHGISLTLDQLKAMGLKRRGVESSIEDVQAAIDVSVMPFQIRFGSNRYSQVTSDGTFFVSVYIYTEVSGRQIGYRVLHRRLTTKHKYIHEIVCKFNLS